jgi:hypothetical protein
MATSATDLRPGEEAGVGAVYRPGETEPAEIRPLGPDDQILNEGYFFALDAEGRLAWPFRHFYLSGGAIFAQRWRLGAWTYGKELDLFRAMTDDRWVPTSAQAAARWIDRCWGRVWSPQKPRPPAVQRQADAQRNTVGLPSDGASA